MFSASFSDYTTMWRKMLGDLEFWQSPDYEQRLPLGELVFPLIRDSAQPFLEVVKGNRDRITANDPPMKTMNFANRAFKRASTSALPADKQLPVERRLEDTFFLGVTFHLLFCSFPTRDRIPELDLATVLNDSPHENLVADRLMSRYNQDMDDLPEDCFRLYVGKIVEPELRDWGVGVFRRGKAESHLRNLFYAGARYAMKCDTSTVSLAPRLPV